ncbi:MULTISPECIES: GntR family transcriptional regulator [Pandoraea]|uniref:GntR family transcriptional regulator n=1 Tax=Pandoraea TaxID=93217 RepID=UPI001F5DD94A|nr:MULTISPECIES: GntR family transcriptional regulator [Pandoraea]MCI3205560.1 GntR family transcriptional regulator [Pandoraea sp. LA3]MDN4583588.1 GntR family transcriptional regulator [Pandoraea capi]
MTDNLPPANVAKSASNLAAQIYVQLKTDIFDFRLLPGDRFSEGDIATRMQVSRTPVRQALFWLQREGYVEVHFRSGWQVRAFDFKYFEDLYEIRVMMETTAIAKIVAADAASRLDALRETWCVPVKQQLEDPATVAAMDEAFHARLVAAVGNQEMARMHEEVTEKIRIIRRLDFTKKPRIAATYKEHGEILTAIFAGDATLAQQMIGAHIAESQAEVKRITLYMMQAARERYAAREGEGG